MFGRRTVLVWIGLLLLSCIFLMGQGSECPWGSETVDFPDPNLEEAIRSSMGIYNNPLDPPPYYWDNAKIAAYR